MVGVGQSGLSQASPSFELEVAAGFQAGAIRERHHSIRWWRACLLL